MPRVPTHRNIWRHASDQDRAYHASRVFGAIRAAWAMLQAMQPMRAGLYEVDSAKVLAARVAVERAVPYLEDQEAAT